jgi:hypothetical protein
MNMSGPLADVEENRKQWTSNKATDNITSNEIINGASTQLP